jgi:hypothetical protein
MFFLISTNPAVEEGSPRKDGESFFLLKGSLLFPVSLEGKEDCSELTPLTTPEKEPLSLPVDLVAIGGLASGTFCIVIKGKASIEITPFLNGL